jgi:hypothetical protein
LDRRDHAVADRREVSSVEGAPPSAPSPSATDWIDSFAERTAIIEHDAGLPRAEADAEAFRQLRSSMPAQVERIAKDAARGIVGDATEAGARTRLEPELTVDSQLRPFVEALARLLVADLKRRPPGGSRP